MDEGWCASAWLFRIQQGNSDGVKLDGCTVIVGLDFPGPTLFDGNGTARVYIADEANAEQHREIEAIFQGTKGGPLEVIAGLVTNWLPAQSTKIDLQEEGDTLTASAGSFGQVKSRLLKDEAGRVMTLQNAGFASALQFNDETVELAPSASRWSDPDMPRQFETKSGAVATFNWSVN